MASKLRRLLAPAGLAVCLAVGFAAGAVDQHSTADAAAGAPANRQALHDNMRELWAGEHIVWTRCYIISAGTLPDNLPDTADTAARLLANQKAIGNAFKPFYGDEAGDALAGLLRQHILIAVDLIDAVKADNAVAIQQASDAWYANAHDIAVLLNSLNPENWPVDAVEALLDQHLNLTATEAVARITSTGSYEPDIKAYDAVHGQILQLADALSDGIIAQFPQKFAR
jgi:hypothetical protein